MVVKGAKQDAVIRNLELDWIITSKSKSKMHEIFPKVSEKYK